MSWLGDMVTDDGHLTLLITTNVTTKDWYDKHQSPLLALRTIVCRIGMVLWIIELSKWARLVRRPILKNFETRIYGPIFSQDLSPMAFFIWNILKRKVECKIYLNGWLLVKAFWRRLGNPWRSERQRLLRRMYIKNQYLRCPIAFVLTCVIFSITSKLTLKNVSHIVDSFSEKNNRSNG